MKNKKLQKLNKDQIKFLIDLLTENIIEKNLDLKNSKIAEKIICVLESKLN